MYFYYAHSIAVEHSYRCSDRAQSHDPILITPFHFTSFSLDVFARTPDRRVRPSIRFSFCAAVVCALTGCNFLLITRITISGGALCFSFSAWSEWFIKSLLLRNNGPMREQRVLASLNSMYPMRRELCASRFHFLYLQEHSNLSSRSRILFS